MICHIDQNLAMWSVIYMYEDVEIYILSYVSDV